MNEYVRKSVHYIRPLLRYGIFLVVIGLICRWIFYGYNHGQLEDASIGDFAIGSWFDIVTLALWFIPLWLVWLFPIRNKGHHIYLTILKLTAYICYIPAVALNLVDVGYYKFITKRSTKELFAFFTHGEDFGQLWTQFVQDYWWLFVVCILSILLHECFFRKFIRPLMGQTYAISVQVLVAIIAIPCIVILGRGGFQLKPISPIDAATFTTGNKVSLVLNTPFVVLKSFGKESLEEKHYYDAATLDSMFNPIRKSVPAGLLPDKTNVVIMILEGFGIEFVGKYGFAKESYTPFLDSLLEQSHYYEFAYANGRTSIESVPSILASMPSWMSTSYINSPYEDNKLVGLPRILKSKGYTSAFFHGATNGSMRFDVFAKQLGFDAYFGRKEYNNDAHFDGKWGIMDEYFNPWVAKQLDQITQPFLATLFTLSSHHPYYVPPHFQDKIKPTDQPIAASIKYADYALSLFFEAARKTSWYDNTLFVICADHTPGTATDSFYNYKLVYRIPIAYYHPTGKVPAIKDSSITQQINIMPTLLDYLNVDTSFYTLGISDFDSMDKYALMYAEGTYLFFTDKYQFDFKEDTFTAVYLKDVYSDIRIDPASMAAGYMPQKQNTVKAIIQRYNQDVKRNHTWVPSNQ